MSVQQEVKKFHMYAMLKLAEQNVMMAISTMETAVIHSV